MAKHKKPRKVLCPVCGQLIKRKVWDKHYRVCLDGRTIEELNVKVSKVIE